MMNVVNATLSTWCLKLGIMKHIFLLNEKKISSFLYNNFLFHSFVVVFCNDPYVIEATKKSNVWNYAHWGNFWIFYIYIYYIIFKNFSRSWQIFDNRKWIPVSLLSLNIADFVLFSLKIVFLFDVWFFGDLFIK